MWIPSRAEVLKHDELVAGLGTSELMVFVGDRALAAHKLGRMIPEPWVSEMIDELDALVMTCLVLRQRLLE